MKFWLHKIVKKCHLAIGKFQTMEFWQFYEACFSWKHKFWKVKFVQIYNIPILKWIFQIWSTIPNFELAKIFAKTVILAIYSLVHKPPAPSKETLNKLPFWASYTEPLSTLSTSKNCLIFINILNFTWTLNFFKNDVRFSNYNWFPKINFFSAKELFSKKISVLGNQLQF